MEKNGYTKSQLNAIKHISGNLQLIACAGSGKTEVVAQRVVNLLKTEKDRGAGCKPENIIAFTFTDKAAAELKERIQARCQEKLGSIDGLANMYIGTIHGFCLELLKDEVPRYMKYEVLNEVQQALLIDRYSKKSGLTQCTTLDGIQLKRFTDTRHYIGALSIIREDEAEDEDLLKENSVVENIQMYEDLLHQKGYLDYSGLLKEAAEELTNNKILRKKLSERLKHLIVDEYQDLNPIQERVVSTLHKLGADICVVGDDDQTIYQWRGSDVKNILLFEKRYKDVKQVRLEENFRSSEGVVTTSRDFIRSLFNRLPKEMQDTKAQSYEPGDITALWFESPEDEAKHIANTCKAMRGLPIKEGENERGISWSDMAILLRSVRRDGEPILDALTKAGIPCVITGMDNLFEKPETEAARQLFYFYNNEISIEELKDAWEFANFGTTPSNLKNALDHAVSVHQKIYSNSERDVHNLQEQFLKFLELAKLREENIPNGLGEVFFYNLGKFSQVITDFESINFHLKPADKFKDFASFLRFHADKVYPEGWQDNTFISPDAVRIMTIHQSKGLQWPAVFIPQVVRNRFPAKGVGGRTAWHLIPADAFKNSLRYKGGFEDEQRLFYVAMTRSQKFLHVSGSPTPGNRNAQVASDFYHKFIESKFVKRRHQNYEDRTKLAPTPKANLSNVTLSFSDVKYFFECPYHFKLRVLYGFNSPIDQALGYGKSLHDALAEVHSKVLNGEKINLSESDGLVQRHLRTPYASPKLRENLENSAKQVIEAYIQKNSDNFKNIEFSEKAIEIALGDGISVAGRIDLVRRVDTGEVTIVDLKSTDRAQAESVTEKQLHIYALGYKELTGRNADFVEIYELDEQKQKKRSVDEVFIEEVKNDIRRAAKGLRQNDLPAQPSQKSCGQCDYCMLCSSAVKQK
jgi:DNA helicase-2/ATP-dependent DNA helicase PcrA